MKQMIFHIPFELTDHVSGTQIRPKKMRQAFENIGYVVHMIDGKAVQRKDKIAKLKKAIDRGASFDFMYAESSTEPTLLTESHHLPTHPFLDFGLFQYCRKKGIPIGLFYRDIYWNFPFYGDLIPFWKKVIAKWFYRYDLRQYQKWLSVLYLPSAKMLDYIPATFDQPVKDLPPAALFQEEVKPLPASMKSEAGQLNILYVGGLGLVYQMHVLFEVVSNMPSMRLTLCCREAEWEAHKNEYEKYLSSNIRIVHKSGAELLPLYAEADMVSLFVAPNEYRNFAVPIKLFEYLGFGKPIIATSGTAVGDYIEQWEVGWSIPYEEKALLEVFKEITDDINVLSKMASAFPGAVEKNTWEARATQVANDLMSL